MGRRIEIIPVRGKVARIETVVRGTVTSVSENMDVALARQEAYRMAGANDQVVDRIAEKGMGMEDKDAS